MSAAIRDVRLLFEALGEAPAEHGGAPVDLLAHSLQCADILAGLAPADIELQLAGLFHDLGAIVASGTPAIHAAIGARLVENPLGARCAELVALHVQAKRYLLTVDISYRALLHPRSVAALRAQGGLMTPPERRSFEAHHEFETAITLRRADDAANSNARVVRPLHEWRRAVESLALARS